MTHQAPPTDGTSLRELLADAAQVLGPADVRARGCTSQWRHVRPGDVFVAVTEDDDDGHDQATEAARRGAAAIICERPLPVFDVPQFVVADSRAAYGRLCQALVGNPSRQLRVIGVAGAAGKTTIARLLLAIFREAGIAAATLDSFGDWDGGGDAPALTRNQILSPPRLARSLAEMIVSGATHAIVEASSRQLSQAALAGVTLDAACISHVGRGDIQWHGSLENYRDAQTRIVALTRPEAAVILNADDPCSARILSDLSQPVLTFGLKQQAEISAEIVEQQVNEQTFVLTAGDESVGVRTPIIGDHHVYNCLAAAATCLTYGIELTQIARGLEAVKQLPGRMERVMCGQPFAAFVDAANSPDTLQACLRAARPVTTGRLICVFGPNLADSLASECYVETDSPKTLKMPDVAAPQFAALGRVAGTLADLPILTSASDVGNTPHSMLASVRRGLVNPQAARVIANRLEAIAFALHEARVGDTVVVAGMGEREYMPDRSHTRWQDREVIRSLLHGPRSAAARSKQAA